MDESSDALDSAVYAAGIYRLINEGDLMGLNSIAGQGMIGNAQNSLMGQGIGSGAIGSAQMNAAMNAANIANAPLVQRTMPSMSSMPYEKDRSRLSMSLNIVQADNGFIVNITDKPYTDPTPHIAVTIEDICTIITSQLASKMLERVE